MILSCKKYSYFSLLTLFLTSLLLANPAQAFEWNGKTGDGNGDNNVNIQDVVYVINLVLGGTGAINGSDCAQDNDINIQDIVCTINLILNPGSSGGGTQPLNDTGVTSCANESTNNLGCPQPNQPNQDAQHGRDATHNNNSDGHAGFSFTKLDNEGNALSASAQSWACVKDNVTQLIWEVKTTDGLLRDRGHTYSWYNSTGINDGNRVGTDNGGVCFDELNCDTEKFARRVNIHTLCGKSDWRVPSKKELEGIVSLGHTSPSIDLNYFPNSLTTAYWTSTPYAIGVVSAWLVHLQNGGSFAFLDTARIPVRLVRTAN